MADAGGHEQQDAGEAAFRVLAQRLSPGCELRSSQRLTGGVSAIVHALELIDADGLPWKVVLRQHGDDGEVKPRQRDVAATEYALLGALHAQGWPVPQPLLLDTSEQLFSGPFLVMSFVEGSTEVPPEEIEAALEIMADTLVRLHRFPTVDLPPLPARLDPVPGLREFLPDSAQSRDLLARLAEWPAAAFTGAPVLLHGDFWPGNLLWAGERLAAILDWEDAALGDPVSDVACCRLELRYRYGLAASQRFTAHYARRSALAVERLALWDIHVGAAALRYMGAWGLAADREAAMRLEATASVTSATATLKQFLDRQS